MSEKPSERAVEIATEAYASLYFYEASASEREGWKNAYRIGLAALIAAGYTQLKEDK